MLSCSKESLYSAKGDIVLLKQCIYRPLPNPTLVSKSNNLVVPENLQAEAEAIANPPPAATVTVSQVKTSPIRSLVYVKGRIVSVSIHLNF